CQNQESGLQSVAVCHMPPPSATETPEADSRERVAGRARRCRCVERLQLVDEVDQLAQPAEGAVIEREDKPAEVGKLVELLWHGPGLEPRLAPENVGELVLKIGDLRRLDRPG